MDRAAMARGLFLADASAGGASSFEEAEVIAERREVTDAQEDDDTSAIFEVDRAESDGLSPLLILGVIALGVLVGILLGVLKKTRGQHE